MALTNMQWRCAVLGALGVVLSMSGCTGTSDREASGAQQAKSFVAWSPQALSANATRLQLGEDCGVGGGPSCVTGLCLHTKPQPNEGHVCVMTCDSTEDCPDGWACVAPIPGPGPAAEFCVPPSGWVPRAVAAKRPMKPQTSASPGPVQHGPPEWLDGGHANHPDADGGRP